MRKTIALFLLLLCALPQFLTAGPARRNSVWHTQPDGTRVQLRLVGDEFGHTFVTMDGIPVIIEEDGSVRLRTVLEMDALESERREALAESHALLARGSCHPSHVSDNTLDYRMNDFPSQGEIHGVVLLVEYADVHFSQDSAAIHDLLAARYDADNYSEPIEYCGWSPHFSDSIKVSTTIIGSARDYFRDQSFGQFVPRFDVIGPLRLSHNRSYYGANNRSGGDSNARSMVKEACQQAYASGHVDFSPYDNDGDGFVDFVYVVYAGSDEAQFGPAESIWAHASSLTESLQLGDVKVSRYACSGELCYDTDNIVAGIGTFVHEFSHVIGMPDFYNTNTSAYGEEAFAMDVWSVLDYGMYNSEGYVPAGYTSFERYSMGWIPMEELNEPVDMSLLPTDECRRGYRCFVSDEDTTSFIVLENIQKSRWNSQAPTYGLMISGVNYNAAAWRSNRVNATKGMHRYHIFPANDIWRAVDESYYEYADYKPTDHLFGKNNYSFGPDTHPASITQLGDTLSKPLTDITRKQNAPCTFRFMGGSNTIASIKDETVTEIYSLDGRQTRPTHPQETISEGSMSKGIYLVKKNGKVQKVYIK